MEKENEFRKVSCLQKHGLLKVNKKYRTKTMKYVENKEYHALLGLTKQERNDIIIIYETMRNKSER